MQQFSCLHREQHISNVIIKLQYTDKKEKKIFLIYKEIQSGAVAKSYTYLD